MDREGRTDPNERMLKHKNVIQLTYVLKRVATRAGIKHGNKVVRFHCLRKFLIDHISSYMSSEKWKQIVGKKISEGAYVSPDTLREDYKRAMEETCFTKPVSERDMELLAKKQAAIMLLKLQGTTEADLKKIFRSRKITLLADEVKVLEELLGHNCQRIVEEAELPGLLAEGLRVASVLPSGKVVVER